MTEKKGLYQISLLGLEGEKSRDEQRTSSNVRERGMGHL